ncbi:hypothetical protein ACOMHN_041254 [Nucella lapillus]
MLFLINTMGTLGNALVLYVYYRSMKRNSTWYIIISLALYDVFICAVVIPLEAVNLFIYLVYTNDLLCRVYRMLGNASILGSMWILLSIGVHTYLKACHPFYHIKIDLTLIVCWSSLILTIPLHIPFSMKLFGVYRKTTSIPGLMGYKCLYPKEAQGDLFFRLLMAVRISSTMTSVVLIDGQEVDRFFSLCRRWTGISSQGTGDGQGSPVREQTMDRDLQSGNRRWTGISSQWADDGQGSPVSEQTMYRDLQSGNRRWTGISSQWADDGQGSPVSEQAMDRDFQSVNRRWTGISSQWADDGQGSPVSEQTMDRDLQSVNRRWTGISS